MSRYTPWASLGAFIFIAGMIFILVLSIRNNENEWILLAELLILTSICALIPLILGWIPWRYSTHHAAYGRFVAENGRLPTAKQLPGIFEIWPGYYMLLGSLIEITNVDPILLFHITCVFESGLALVFLYFFVKTVTQSQKMAAFTALFLGLFVNFIESAAQEAHSGLAQAMMFMMMFIIAKQTQRKTLVNVVIIVVALAVAIISHHLDTGMDLLILTAIWLWGARKQNSSLRFNSSFLILGFVGIIAYWFYQARQSFVIRYIEYIKDGVLGLVAEGFPSPLTVISRENPAILSSGYQAAVKSVHWGLFLCAGLLGLFLIYLELRGRHQPNLAFRALWFTIPWIVLLFILTAIFLTGIGGDAIPIFRIVEFLPVPISIGLAAVAVSSPRFRRPWGTAFNLFLVLLAFVVPFTGVATAFPTALYEGGIVPLGDTLVDEHAATFVGQYTNVGSLTFGDVHSSEALVYWGNREGCFDQKVDLTFEAQDEESLKSLLATSKFSYVSLNIFNTSQHVYYRWGRFGMVPDDSALLRADYMVYLDRVYDNSRVTVYAVTQ